MHEIKQPTTPGSCNAQERKLNRTATSSPSERSYNPPEVEPRSARCCQPQRPEETNDNQWEGLRTDCPSDWLLRTRTLDFTATPARPPFAFGLRPPPPKSRPLGSHPCTCLVVVRAGFPATPRQHPLRSRPSPFPHFLDGRHHLLDIIFGPATGLGPDRTARHGGGGEWLGAGTLLPRRGISRTSCATVHPPPPQHVTAAVAPSVRACVRERALPPAPWALEASARLRTPPGASLLCASRDPLTPHCRQGLVSPGVCQVSLRWWWWWDGISKSPLYPAA